MMDAASPADESKSRSDGGGAGEQPLNMFQVLRDSNEYAAVLSQAGEVSRLASHRLLHSPCGTMDEDDGTEMMAPMARLTSHDTRAPIYRPIGDGALRVPKAARDAGFAAAFVAHLILTFFAAPAALAAAGAERPLASGIASWSLSSSIYVASPAAVSCAAATFAVLLVTGPGEGRHAVAALALPIAACAVLALACVVVLGLYIREDAVVVGMWSAVPLVFALRAAFWAKRLRGLEAVFDAMLDVVAVFFATARGPVLKLVFGALAVQGLHLSFWSATRSYLRRLRCEEENRGDYGGPYVVADAWLFCSLFWTTQVVRTVVRCVVSGCAMHYLVVVAADSSADVYDQVAAQNGHDRDDDDGDVDELLLAHADVLSAPSPRERARNDDRSRQRRKELRAAARKAEKFFISIALSTSFGTVAKGALLCPIADFVRDLLDLLGVSKCCRRCTARGFLPKFANTYREVAFVHVALNNKALASASAECARVVDESGVADLLSADCVVPILQTYRASAGALNAAFFAALTLIAHHASFDPKSDCRDANALVIYFLFAFVAFALAVEPLIAAVHAFYLGFAQAPQGLARVDPILYRRFARVLDRDHATASPRAARRGAPGGRRPTARELFRNVEVNL